MSKSPKKPPKTGKKVVAMPPTWYFPTPDPDIFIACDYDAGQQRYNRNCRKVSRADIGVRLAGEVKRAATVFNSTG